MSLSIKKKAIKKTISVVTTIATVVCMSGVASFSVTSLAIADVVDGALIKSNATNPDGTPTLKSLDVYIVKLVGTKKFKRLMLNPTVFESYGHLSWGDIQTVSQAVMDEYTNSGLVRVDTDPDEKVYAMAPDGDVGSKSWVNVSAEKFLSIAGSEDGDSIYTINATDAGSYSAVGDITGSAELEAFYSAGTLPAGTAGDLAASLSATTPASGTLVMAQAVAHLADFTLTGTGTVKSVTLKRIGVSADTTPVNVYLFDGATRITDGASFSSGSLLTFSATSLFEVDGAKTISVKSDIANTTSGQTVGVELNAVTLESGSVSGLPVSGNLHSIASATLASVAVGTSTASGAVDPGTGILVWQDTVTIGTRDVLLNRLALRQIGSIAAADINNFVLSIDGTEVETVADLDSNGYVTFAVSQAMKTGARTIKVHADIIGGSGRTVQMSLRGAYDITSVDTQYNANVLATGTFPASPTAFTVNSGAMTVAKATDSQSTNLTVGASDQSLASYTFTAYGEDIKVETLKIGILGTTTGTITNVTLQNVRVMVDGSQVGSTTAVPAAASFLANTGTQFTTNFTVNPGTPVTVEIRGDMIDSEDNGADNDDIAAGTMTAVQAVLVGGALSANATPQVSLGTINVPTTANTLGNDLTIASGSMSIAQTSNYGAQTVVVPTTAYKIGSYQLTGNSTEAVNLNTIYVGWNAGHSCTPATDLSDLYVVYGGTTSTVKGSVSSTALNSNSWSINETLAVNATMQIDVYATIASTLSTNNIISTLAVAGITADSATATYADATGITTLTAGVTGQTITGGSGSISAVLDGSTPVSAIVDDSGTITTAAFKFSAVNDSYTITDLTLTLANASAVSNVILRKAGETTAIAGGTKPGATSLTYSGLSIPVAANGSTIVEVDLELSTVGTGAGTTGSSLLTTMTAATAKNSQGTSTAGNVTESDPAGNVMYIYKAIPTITPQTLPSSVLVAGSSIQKLSKFTISSNGGPIGWQQVVFTIAKSITGTDTLTLPTLYDVTGGGSGTIVTTTGSYFTGSVETSGDGAGGLVMIPTTEQSVNGSKTYELRVTVGGAPVAGDSITTNIAAVSSYASAKKAFAYYAGASAATTLVSDVGAGGTISANDIRETAQSSYTTADVSAGATAMAHNGALKLTEAYGLTATGTITWTEGATADKLLSLTPALTGGMTGLTCILYKNSAVAYAVTDAVTTIEYVECTGTNMSLNIATDAAPLTVAGDSGADVDSGLLVFTITKGTDYAVGSAVAATDSDAGITLTAGVPAAASFIWSDQSATSHANTTTDWASDVLVKNIATDTQSLSK